MGTAAEEKIAQAAVLEAFREGQISSGKAAELLGITRQEFLDLLAGKQIPVCNHPLKDITILKSTLAEPRRKATQVCEAAATFGDAQPGPPATDHPAR